MADEDDDQKTEEPSQKKLEEARERGQVVSSREINHWFMIMAATLVLAMFGPGMLRDLARLLLPFIESPDTMPTDADGLRGMMVAIFGRIVATVALPLALLVAAALGAGFLQHGFVFSTESIKPKLEKISPGKGLGRMFGGQALAEFLKGLLKIVAVGTVAGVMLWPALGDLANVATMDIGALLALTKKLTMRLLGGVLGAMALIAGLDFMYQRFQHMKKLRMSRQEVKEEYRQTEGDPAVKGRLRQLRQERARRRMMAAVPTSDVVITNPTHYAVALQYDGAKMTAPRLVAKGADLVAHRIRELAKENDVPIVENPPLARGLYGSVELDQEIPPEHYKAVAEVIGYIMRLKQRRSGAAAPAAGPGAQ